jgi:hypothetical protein
MNQQHRELMEELHEKMGRNLMLFQAIERGLKMVLPYIHPDGSRKDGIASFQKYKSTVQSKTMGPVVGDWLESMELSIGAPEEKLHGIIEEQFKKIVASRNKLVHGGLFELPGLSTVDKAGIENALRYLDEQYQEAEWLYKWVSQQLLCWMTSFRLNKPNQPKEF